MLSYLDIERYVQLTAHWTLDFWEQFENDWLVNRVLSAAKRNPLYPGIETIRDIKDLESYPTIRWDDIDHFAEKHDVKRLITATPATSWYSSGTSGRRKIVWSSEEDLDMYRRVFGRRLYNIGIGRKSRALVLGAPGYASSIYPKLGLNWLAETVYVPFTEMSANVDKILSGRYDLLITIPPVAYHLASDGSKQLNGTLRRVPVLSDLLARSKLRRLKHVFGYCQVMMAGDFRTDLQDKLITEFYGRPPCLSYASTEMVTAGGECLDHETRYHTGEMHPAFDDVIPLIIPLEELEKERLDPAYEPKKVLLSRAPSGMIGEAVFTVNSDCFVRLNYGMGDIIRKGKDKSDCPTPLPTFEVLGRAFRKVSEPELGLEGYEATVVKIAVAPFCVKYMMESLSRVRREGKIRDWFSILSHVKGKPCLTLFLDAEDVENPDKLKEEILENVRSNVELEYLVIVTEMGLASLNIEFIPNDTLNKWREKKLRLVSEGKTTLGQMKVPKLVLTSDFAKSQGLF